jgi:transcriptional regulator with XRE-family HTH domain
MENQLGKLIRQERLNQGLTVRQLGEKLGLDYTYLHRIEMGERFLNEKNVPAVANWLCLPWDYVLHLAEADRTEFRRSRMLAKALEPPRGVINVGSIADNDRNAFLTMVTRDKLRFPEDRDRIPETLFGLQVIEDDVVFGSDDSRVYAGLFVGGHTYRGSENAIVVASRYVRPRAITVKGDYAIPETKVFHVLHELGHYRLHWPQDKKSEISSRRSERPLYCSSQDNGPLEQEANAYAETFLMPRTDIETMMRRRKSISKKEAVEWSELFFVERRTLKIRLERLGYGVYD